MDKRILILGKGFFGSRLAEAGLGELSTEKFHSYRAIKKEIDNRRPDIVINCIGDVGRTNVGDCEKDIDKTLFSNVFIPAFLAEAAWRGNFKLVHLSSGCVYNMGGFESRGEEAQPDYLNLFYSRSKIYAESVLKNLVSRADILIVRIRLPLDVRVHPRNLLTKLLTFKEIADIPNSVTYVPDFIEALKHLLRLEAKGIYNVVNKGALRYPELLEVYRKHTPGFAFQKVEFKKLGLERTNLFLSTVKLEQTGFPLRDIHDILEECVSLYLKNEAER